MLGNFLFLLAVVATTATARNITGSGREEIVGGEFNFFESIAGLIISRVGTSFFGNAKIINRNKHLHIADKLNYCKESQGDKNSGLTAMLFGYNVAAYTFANTIRNTADIVITIAYFAYACRERDRVNRLHNTFGAVVAVLGGVYVHAILAKGV